MFMNTADTQSKYIITNKAKSMMDTVAAMFARK